MPVDPSARSGQTFNAGEANEIDLLAVVFDNSWKALAIVVFATIYQQIETYFFTAWVSKKQWTSNPQLRWRRYSSRSHLS